MDFCWAPLSRAPDCLVQGTDSRIAPDIDKRKEQVVFWGKGWRAPKMSLALGQPPVAPVQVWVALEQDTFLGLSAPHPKRRLALSLIDLGANPEFGPRTRQSGSQPWFLEKQGARNSPKIHSKIQIGCSFFAYSWKLPAYSGIFYLQSCLGAFLLTVLEFFYLQLELFAYSGEWI